MSNPLISIVLPVYNGERFLRESIDSCLAQTYPHWELIIVDDCSTDGSPAIIAEYVEKDERIRSIRHKVNRKLPASLNTGFGTANGDYLTWTSDDNIYKPEALEEMLTYLEAHPEFALVYAKVRFIDEEGNDIGPVPFGPKERMLKQNMVGSCFLYRREVQKKIGFYDEQMLLVEDYDYWMRTMMYFDLAPLHKTLYLRRVHPNSLTSRHFWDIERMMAKMLNRHTPKIPWVTPKLYKGANRYLLFRARERRDIIWIIRFGLRVYSPGDYVKKGIPWAFKKMRDVWHRITR